MKRKISLSTSKIPERGHSGSIIFNNFTFISRFQKVQLICSQGRKVHVINLHYRSKWKQAVTLVYKDFTAKKEVDGAGQSSGSVG